MIIEVLKKAKMPYTVLEFNRYKGVSRFRELICSPHTLELMRIIAKNWITSRDGRKMLQQILNKQEFCELDPNSGVMARIAPESTFRLAMGRLVEFDLVDEQFQKIDNRPINTYKLKHNLLLFRNRAGAWIPVIVFTCPEKQAIVKAYDTGDNPVDKDILEIIPRSSFCNNCRANCDLFKQLKIIDRLRELNKEGGNREPGKT